MNNLLTLIASVLLSLPNLSAQDVSINEGSGSFDFVGNKNGSSITVFYHKPKSFTPNSKVLLVIPGAGRNADDYRDSWIETSEKQSVLVISPSYPEKEYDYGGYHLGGVVKDLDLSKGVSFKKGTNQVLVDETVLKFNVNQNRNDWIFGDFDRLFEIVKKTTNSNQNKYDVFGHSAGGQILHRFVLLHPNSKADRILASNAGTYTLPDFETDYPFGIMNVGIDKQQLEAAFQKDLVLLIGELDNESETRGRMLRSKTADLQGTHRLARGKNFYGQSKKTAKEMGYDFKWSLKVVPNVGHDQKKMAAAAAGYLYGNNPFPIAYSSNTSGNREIYLTNAEGKEKIKITDYEGSDGYPAWSPDGKRLAFYAKYDKGHTWSMHSMNVDGTDRKRLTFAKDKWDSSPTWSPDGKQIAFAREYEDENGAWQEEIWMMDSDGSNQKQLANIVGRAPCFMKDGRILFHSKTETGEICIANADGSSIIQLTDNDAKDMSPQISPDGKHIAFISDRDGNQEVYVMDLDGSNQTRLTHNETAEWDSCWSADGSKIIFASETEDYLDLYMINKDGTGLKKFITNGSQPAWYTEN